jgi:hypothetical protein
MKLLMTNILGLWTDTNLLYSYMLFMLADTVFSLILGPESFRGLRGEFCLRQSSNPLKYNICRSVYECRSAEVHLDLFTDIKVKC